MFYGSQGKFRSLYITASLKVLQYAYIRDASKIAD